MKIIANNENKNELLKMLAWIELCGNIGHTCQCFKVGVDGDGSGQLKFQFDSEEEQNNFKELKSELLKEYEINGDLKIIALDK